MRWHREPLIHFLVLGAGLFLLYGAVSSPAPEAGVIDITAGEIGQLVRSFQLTWQRPPTEAEVDGLIEERIREEVFYREALAMGLDRDDTIIRRRLRQKMEFLSADITALVEPTESELAAFLAEHPEAFQRPPRVSFVHIYLSRDRRGAAVRDDAERLLAELERTETVNAADFGDPSLLPREFDSLSDEEVAKHFGSDFVEQLQEIPAETWTGPVESSYGLHLVYVRERFGSELPKLDEVRDSVARDWTSQRRTEAAAAFYGGLRQRYLVNVERAAVAPSIEVAEVER